MNRFALAHGWGMAYALGGMVDELEGAGWRVKHGQWPQTRLEEDQTDFVVLAGPSLFPVNGAAAEAMQGVIDNHAVLSRQDG